MDSIEGWKKTTCGEGRKLLSEGNMVWYRPDGILTKEHPELDTAYYKEAAFSPEKMKLVKK